MSKDAVQIDTGGSYPTLKHAPIVEAVVEVRCSVTSEWSKNTVERELSRKLDDYSLLDSQSEFQSEIRIRQDQVSAEPLQDVGWKGARFQSTDKKFIAKFYNDSFALSRLEPYDSWNGFISEVFRVWSVYAEVGKPVDIERIGLRFINRIVLTGDGIDIADYLISPPDAPAAMDVRLAAFLHKDTFRIPETSYFVQIIRTLQHDQSHSVDEPSLVLDIDVYNTAGASADESILRTRLDKLRELKNQAFFGSITPTLHRRLEG